MFVGVPASGKSTFIEKYQNQITSQYGVDCVISSDAVIEDVAFARGLTYAEVFRDSIDLAGKYVDVMLGILSLQQKNFILDSTNLSIKSRKRKLDLLIHPQNYNKFAIIFDDITPEQRQNRLEKRAVETGKIIPKHVIDTMCNSYQIPTIAEGFTQVMTAQQFAEGLGPVDKPVIFGGTTFG